MTGGRFSLRVHVTPAELEPTAELGTLIMCYFDTSDDPASISTKNLSTAGEIKFKISGPDIFTMW